MEMEIEMESKEEDRKETGGNELNGAATSKQPVQRNQPQNNNSKCLEVRSLTRPKTGNGAPTKIKQAKTNRQRASFSEIFTDESVSMNTGWQKTIVGQGRRRP